MRGPRLVIALPYRAALRGHWTGQLRRGYVADCCLNCSWGFNGNLNLRRLILRVVCHGARGRHGEPLYIRRTTGTQWRLGFPQCSHRWRFEPAGLMLRMSCPATKCAARSALPVAASLRLCQCQWALRPLFRGRSAAPWPGRPLLRARVTVAPPCHLRGSPGPGGVTIRRNLRE